MLFALELDPLWKGLVVPSLHPAHQPCRNKTGRAPERRLSQLLGKLRLRELTRPL